VAARIRERRAEKSASRTGTTPPVEIAPPVVHAPPTPAPVPAPQIPATAGAPTNAEQARAAVEAAGRLVDGDDPGGAMLAIRGAMPLLPTRDDSVTALFHLSRAMIQRSGQTGDAAAHQRGCSILSLIAKATSHPKAGEIRSFSAQECK
jgi:hypothetical protein